MQQFSNRVAGVQDRPKRTIQWANTLERFGLRAQLIHAVLGLAVMLMLIMGFAIAYWPKDWAHALHGQAVTLHKAVGFWLMLCSVLWYVHRRWQPKPACLPNQPVPDYRVAKLVHKLMIFLCIVMPLSGWIMVSAWGDTAITVAPYLHLPAIAKTDPDFAKAMLGVHIVIAFGIIGLLGLHLLGVFYHQILQRDPILKRIIPRFKPPAGYYRFQFDKARADANKLK